MSHLEPAGARLLGGGGVAVADDVFESVAAAPLAAVAADVSLHGVGHSEVVPGPKQTDRCDG